MARDLTENKGSELRLLQFVPDFLPTSRPDVHILFGKYLPRYGVRCDIVGRRGDGEIDVAAFASVSTPPHASSRWRQEFSYLGLVISRLRSLRRDTYAVCQVRDMVVIGLICSLWCRLRGIKFAYWMSFLMSEGRIIQAQAKGAMRTSPRQTLVLIKGYIERYILYKIVLKIADHVFVQSDYMAEYLEGVGIPRVKTTSVPMGIDLESLNEAWKKIDQGSEDIAPRITYLGTLDRARELKHLLEALVVVRRTLSSATMVFIGGSETPSDDAALVADAKSLGVADAVTITGWLDRRNALQELHNADIAISHIPRGTLFDVSSPTKIVEYLAIGMVTVANDNPDQARVLGESGAGWLTDGTPEGYASAVLAICSDLEGARERASKGPPYVAKHRSYDEIAKRVATSYSKIVQA